MSDAEAGSRPLQQLRDAAQALGVGRNIPHLEGAAELSGRLITFARSWLAENSDDDDPPSDLIACGSLARYEFTPASDFDYLVVAHRLDPRPRGPRDLLEKADQLRVELATAMGSDVGSPGGTRLFGVAVSAMDVAERIGLQDDTNHDQTRRLLLLEESMSLSENAASMHVHAEADRAGRGVCLPSSTPCPAYAEQPARSTSTPHSCST